MPRPHKTRRIYTTPGYTLFKPAGVTLKKNDVIELRLDELEAMRLANLEGLYQEQGAERMNTSRATFGRILEEARRKVTKALILGKALKIGGGNVDLQLDPDAVAPGVESGEQSVTVATDAQVPVPQPTETTTGVETTPSSQTGASGV